MYFMAGRYAGISRPSFHGPASAVAPSAPSAAARDARSAFALGGSPSTCEASVTTMLHAFVASSTLFENLVESSASSIRLALNCSFALPSSATPDSFIPCSDDCRIRRCDSSSAPALESTCSTAA